MSNSCLKTQSLLLLSGLQQHPGWRQLLLLPPPPIARLQLTPSAIISLNRDALRQRAGGQQAAGLTVWVSARLLAGWLHAQLESTRVIHCLRQTHPLRQVVCYRGVCTVEQSRLRCALPPSATKEAATAGSHCHCSDFLGTANTHGGAVPALALAVRLVQ